MNLQWNIPMKVRESWRF